MQNKNKPVIRFNGFQEDWEIHSLKSLCESIEYGLNAASKPYDGINKYLRITDIDEDSRTFLEKDITSPKINLTNSNNYLLQKGDILFARTGASVGKTYLYKEKDGKVYFAGFLIRARIKKEISSQLIFQNTLTDNYKKFIRITSQRSGQPGVNSQEYGEYQIKLPKNEIEQNTIGNYFENIDKLIAKHKQKYNKLTSLKIAMLDKLFPKQGKLVPEIRFKEFIGDWSESELGQIGDPYTGLSGKTKKDFGHGAGRYITYMNVFSNPISDNNGLDIIEIDSAQNTVQKGDVLFTVSSETANEVGMSSVWTGDFENIYLNSFCFGYRPKIQIDNYFLANLLRTQSFRKKMIFLAQGISRYNISKNKVMNLSITLPIYEEQVAIGLYFKNLDLLIKKHNNQIIKLKNIKDALLSKMII